MSCVPWLSWCPYCDGSPDEDDDANALALIHAHLRDWTEDDEEPVT